MTFDARQCPIYVNCRDRVSDLRELVAWLEQAGHQRIILLDNDSSYPPLLDYFAQSPHEILRLGSNLGSRAIWQAGLAPNAEHWVYTDPDVVPLEECPADAVELLHELLLTHSGHPKAGLGTYLEDTPEFPSKEWERSLVSDERCIAHQGNVAVYSSLVDTTFALYRPGTDHILNALRTGFPYQVRHTSWYRDDEPSDEELYYLERAREGPLGSSWAQGRR